MSNDQLTNYVGQARKSGKDDEQIRHELLGFGFQNDDIEKAMKVGASSTAFFRRSSFVLIAFGVVAASYLASAYYFSLWPFVASLRTGVTGTTSAPGSGYLARKHTPDTVGFAITLPSGWDYESIGSGEPDIKTAFVYKSSDGKRTFMVSIFGNKDPDSVILHDWAKQDAMSYDSQTKEDLSSAKIIKNLGPIYGGEVKGKVYKRVYLMRGVLNEIYRISVEMNKSNLWMSDFDQIVSTFNFFEPRTDIYNTYKSLQFSFEITYPSTWRVREESDGVGLRNYYNPLLDSPTDPLDITISYLKDENPKQLPIFSWLKVGSNSIFISNEKSRQTVNLGEESVRVVRDTEARTPNRSRIVYIIRNGKDIIIANYIYDRNVKYVQSPDRIIETLKFTTFDPGAYSKLVEEETRKIVGEDKDNDEVWDYIQQWIDKNYSGDYKIRQALRLMAKEQQFKLINYRDREAIIKHSHETFGVNCLFKASPENSSKILGAFKAAMINTEARVLTKFKADGQLGGQVYTQPEEETVTKYCGF